MLELDELTAIVGWLKEGVVVFDVRMRVVLANAAAASLFAPARLTLGRTLPPVPSDPGFERFVRGLFDRRLTRNRRLVEREGATFEILGISPHGARRVAALIITNVTEQTRRERARTEFVSNAAHELLTPLTGIASAAHVLESGAKEVPEMRDRFLDHIARECNRLTRVARGLLVLARAQSGEEPPRPERVDLRSLMQDVLDASSRDTEVKVEYVDDVAAFVDRDLVEIALSNLLANAIRHAQDADVAVAVAKSSTGDVEILIDAGPTNDAPDFARFRRRFVSGGGRDGGGFGLGISIAVQAIETVGGRVEYIADNGSTRVRVDLPAEAYS